MSSKRGLRRLTRPTVATQIKSRAALNKRVATAEYKLTDASLRPRTSQTRALYHDDVILHKPPAPAVRKPGTKPKTPGSKKKKKKIVAGRQPSSPVQAPLRMDTNRMLAEAMQGGSLNARSPEKAANDAAISPASDEEEVEPSVAIASRSLTAENLKSLERLSLEERLEQAHHEPVADDASAISNSIHAPSLSTYAMTSVSQRGRNPGLRPRGSRHTAQPVVHVQPRELNGYAQHEFDDDDEFDEDDEPPRRAAVVVRKSSRPQTNGTPSSRPPPPRRRSIDAIAPMQAIAESPLVVTDFQPAPYSPKRTNPARRSVRTLPSPKQTLPSPKRTLPSPKRTLSPPIAPGSSLTRTSRGSKTSKGVPRVEQRLSLVQEIEFRLDKGELVGPLDDCVAGFELTGALQRAADELRAKGRRITDNDVSELSGYRTPRQDVLLIMAAFVAVVEAPMEWTSLHQDWETTRLLLKSRRILPKVDQFDVRIGVPLGAVAIEATARLQADAISSESKSVARVLAWLHAYGRLVLNFEETIEEVRRRNGLLSSSSVSRQDIREIKTTKQASKLTHTVLKAVSCLTAAHHRRDSRHFAHWGTLQQYLRTSFEADLLEFDVQELAPATLLTIAEQLCQDGLSVDLGWSKIIRCSTATVNLAKWLQAQLAYLPMSLLIA